MGATSPLHADAQSTQDAFDPAVHHDMESLRPFLRSLKPGPVFLIRGSASFSQSGAQAALQRNTIPDLEFSEHIARSNPQLADLKALYTQFQAQRYTGIVAIGGGSVMDYAKVIKLWASRQTPQASPPLCVVPTCFGSGAEVTPFSTVYQGERKGSIADPLMKPEHIILDPSLGWSLTLQQRAIGALDAFCQSLESYWSLRATEQSRALSLRAIHTLAQGQWLTSPHEATLESLILGAHLSGRAITTAKTTAAHALSYGLTSRLGIPHGQAVAMMMLALLRSMRGKSSNQALSPGLSFSCPILETHLGFGVRQIESRIQDVFVCAGLDTRHRVQAPIQEADRLVALVNQERLANHPWSLTQRECHALYLAVLRTSPS